ncbi:hypothetical protein CHL9426_01985 [Campylobacter hyointestinalis subsp. lawsonii]|nr:hypothetical protein CHL9752_02145 [Campylobacter hyointestinalis subsp. lawsonii]RAZ40004.1 hypothetical protein CHL9426_01985 [Campylobacter hyointestinalis subsp. lawsonii]
MRIFHKHIFAKHHFTDYSAIIADKFICKNIYDILFFIHLFSTLNTPKKFLYQSYLRHCRIRKNLRLSIGKTRLKHFCIRLLWWPCLHLKIQHPQKAKYQDLSLFLN